MTQLWNNIKEYIIYPFSDIRFVDVLDILLLTFVFYVFYHFIKNRRAGKLMTGLLRACEKRPVSFDTLDNMIDEIEVIIQNSLDREVSSEKIGELVMEKLKKIDEVAYVRFASVYRQFKDINTFMSELNKLLKEN